MDVQKTASESYHLYGSVQELKVSAATGKVVIEQSAVVVNFAESAGATITSAGTVLKNSTSNTSITVATQYEIKTVDQLKAFRDYVNSGVEFTVPIEIKEDIDLSNESWQPIGTAEHPFYGTINGNGKTITGLSNGTISSTKDAFTTKTTKSYGSAYGFIGLAGAPVADKTLSISNLKFADVNIALEEYGNCVGTLIGYAMDDSHFADFQGNTRKGLAKVTLHNIEVLSGKVAGNNNVGGLIGKSYATETDIENCKNGATVSAKKSVSSGRAAGIMSFTNSAKLTIKGSSNSGSVSAPKYLGGIVSVEYLENTVVDFVVKNNNNSGKLIFTGTSQNDCKAALIVNASSHNWSGVASTSKYDFGDSKSKNTSSIDKIEMPNVGDGTQKETAIYVQIAQGGTDEANGTSVTK